MRVPSWQSVVTVITAFVAGILVARWTPSVEAAPYQQNDPEIDLAGENVRLGSEKSALITRLSKRFALKKFGQVAGAELWFVKIPREGSQERNVGNLHFKGDVLIGVDREWDSLRSEQRTASFMKSFFFAVDHVFGRSGQQMAIVSYTPERKPMDENYHLALTSLRGQLVSISLSENPDSGQRLALVMESIRRDAVPGKVP